MASPSLVRRKSPLRGLFRRNGKPLFASLSARVFRRETLLRKASESTAQVAGFEIHLEGFGPPSLPKRELSVRCGERPHGLSPSRRFPAGMTA